MASSSISAPVVPAGAPGATAPLMARLARRPVAAALGIWLADLVLQIGFNLAAHAWTPAGIDPDFVALCAATLVTVAALTALGAWRVSGFNGPAAWRHLRLLALPAVVICVLPFVGGVKAVDPGLAAFWTGAYALVGLREEGLHRGLILHLLRPSGAVRAVVLGGLLFGASHLANLLVRPSPAVVFAQMIGAACFGIAFGALRLRTHTIWPLVALHLLSDLLLHFSALPTIPLEVVKDVILLAYAVYLLRDRRALAEPDGAGA
ncbi:MAG TPA: CPBP family intramembrane glutamic endopeptidase [Chloroflexia bacterium]|nr:CPBP family intramembrane glutamic endopeptidase [Chloroflexia bacterium]